MNWVDWIILIILVLGLVNGFREGFVRIVIGFGALIVAFLTASWFHGYATGYLGNRSLARACWRRYSAMPRCSRLLCCLREPRGAVYSVRLAWLDFGHRPRDGCRARSGEERLSLWLLRPWS